MTEKENMRVDTSPRFLDIILIVPNRMISKNGRQLRKKIEKLPTSKFNILKCLLALDRFKRLAFYR